MPYIVELERKWIADGNTILSVGMLTYAITDALLSLPLGADITSVIREKIDEYIDAAGQPSFQLYAEVLGALQAVRLEFHRREPRKLFTRQVSRAVRVVTSDFYSQVIGPYEDQKIAQNGDVF